MESPNPPEKGISTHRYRHEAKDGSLSLYVEIAYFDQHLDKGKSVLRDDGNVFVFNDGSTFTLDGRRFSATKPGFEETSYGVICSPIIMPADASFSDLKNGFLWKCVGMDPDSYVAKIENGLRLIFSRMDSKYVDDPIENIRNIVGKTTVSKYLHIDKEALKDIKKYSLENLTHALLRTFGYDSFYEPESEDDMFKNMEKEAAKQKISELSEKQERTEQEEEDYSTALSILQQDNSVKCSTIEKKVFDYLLSCGTMQKSGRSVFDASVKKYRDLLKIRDAYVSSNGLKGKEKGKLLLAACDDIFLVADVVYGELRRKFRNVPENEIKEHFIRTLEEYGFSTVDMMRVNSIFDQGAYRMKKDVEDEIYGNALRSLISQNHNDIALMNEYLHWDSILLFGDSSLELSMLARITRQQKTNVDGEPVFEEGESGKKDKPAYNYFISGKSIDFDEPGKFYTGKKKIVDALFSIREKGTPASLGDFLERFYKEAGLDQDKYKVYAVKIDNDMSSLASEISDIYLKEGREADESRVNMFLKSEVTPTIDKRLLIEALFKRSGRFGRSALEYLVDLAADGMVDPFEEVGIEELFTIIKKYPDTMDEFLASFLVHSFREYVRPQKVYSENIRAATKVFSMIITYGLEDMPYLLPQFLKIFAKGTSNQVRFGKSTSTEHQFLTEKFIHGELDRWENPLKDYKEAKEKLWLIERAFDSVVPNSTPAQMAKDWEIVTSIPPSARGSYITKPVMMIPARMVSTLASYGIFTKPMLKENGVVDDNGNIVLDSYGNVRFMPWMEKALSEKKEEQEARINPFYEAIFDHRRLSMGACVASCSKLVDAIDDVDMLLNIISPVSGFLDEQGFAGFYEAKQRLDRIDSGLNHRQADYTSEFVFEMIKGQIISENRRREAEMKISKDAEQENSAVNYKGCLRIVDIVRDETSNAGDRTVNDIYQAIKQRIENDADAKEASQPADFDVDDIFDNSSDEF